MKQVTSILKIFFFALLLIGGTACTSNFADINRKDYEVDKNELGRENYNLGATLRGLQGLVVPVKEHLYQFIEALAQDGEHAAVERIDNDIPGVHEPAQPLFYGWGGTLFRIHRAVQDVRFPVRHHARRSQTQFPGHVADDR